MAMSLKMFYGQLAYSFYVHSTESPFNSLQLEEREIFPYCLSTIYFFIPTDYHRFL